MKELEQIFDIVQMSNDTLLIDGVHGIGKSKRTEVWAKNKGYHIETLFLSQMEVGDIIGMPLNKDIDEETVMIWTKPVWLQNMEKASKKGLETVLFLDELNRANKDVLDASLQLVLERQIHQHKLPENKFRTFIVAAQNPADDYQVNELDPALLDRFVTVELKADANEWLNYARENKLNQIIQKYIAKFPKMIWTKPKDGSKGTTPRSWEKVSELLKHTDIKSSAMYTILKGRLGKYCAAEFITFLKQHEQMVGISDVKNLIKEHYDSNESDRDNLNNIKTYLQDIIQDLQPPLLNNLAYQILENALEKNNFLVLNMYVNAMDMEIATAFIKTIKNEHNDHFKEWNKTKMSKYVFAPIVESIVF